MTATPTQAPPTVIRVAVLFFGVAGGVGRWIGSSGDDAASGAEEIGTQAFSRKGGSDGIGDLP